MGAFFSSQPYPVVLNAEEDIKKSEKKPQKIMRKTICVYLRLSAVKKKLSYKKTKKSSSHIRIQE